MNGSSGTPTPEDTPAVLELDQVFEALAHPRRRYLLYSLSAEPERPLREVASELAAWEADVPVHRLADEEFERVYVSLYHNHVPKLVEEGIVEFVEATPMPRADA